MIDVGLQKRSDGTQRIEISPSLSWRRNLWRAADNTDLFTGAHAPVDFMDESSPDHFEQDNTRSWVQYLLSSRAVRLVLHISMCTRTLPVDADAHDVWHINFSDARRVLGQSSKLVGCFVFGMRILYCLYSCAAWMVNRREHSDRSGLVDGRGRALSTSCAHCYVLSKAVVLFREVCQPPQMSLFSARDIKHKDLVQRLPSLRLRRGFHRMLRLFRLLRRTRLAKGTHPSHKSMCLCKESPGENLWSDPQHHRTGRLRAWCKIDRVVPGDISNRLLTTTPETKH